MPNTPKDSSSLTKSSTSASTSTSASSTWSQSSTSSSVPSRSPSYLSLQDSLSLPSLPTFTRLGPLPSSLLRQRPITNTARQIEHTQTHNPTSPSANQSQSQSFTSTCTNTMFTSRKYTPLPTNSGDRQRRRAGGLATWKRYALIVAAGLIVIGLAAFRFKPGGSNQTSIGQWDDTNTYTPQLDDNYSPVDETDYTTPPFRPIDHDGPTDHEEVEEDDDLFHALPIDVDESKQTTSPHDPTSDKAQQAAGADADFTDITDEDAEETEETAYDETKPSSSSSKHPTSFETDPDAASTTYCAEPYSPDKPIVQYALTIDAGSTGSRIHVYKFHNCGPAPQLEYETFMAVNPGLSAYARDPTAAAASLDPLIDEADRVVPASLRSCTPVEVKATAGLRLLGAEESEMILEEVRNRLETATSYTVNGEHAVEIMDGKDEGVYAWITANYLMGKIGEGVPTTDTLAVMDLGGASTQIVFEPKFPANDDLGLVEGEHKYLLTFGGREFVLYQHSYLGYGLMRARRSVHNLVAFTWSFGQPHVDWEDLSEAHMVPNPCLSMGTTRRVELDPPGREAVNVTMDGSNGSFEACNRVVELVMAKDAICEVKPCSFNGVYQPSLLDTFPTGQFLALSYFTDRIKPLLTSRSHGNLSIGELRSIARDVCAGPTAWKKRWGKNTIAMAELEDRPEYCLDLTFMNALLGLGYELSPERELIVEKKLKGVELGWALGAGLALVGKAELTCSA